MSKAVIFDMDGVICHTNPFHSVAFKEFFAKRNVFPTEEEFTQHMYGKHNSYILSHFLGRKIEGEELILLEEEKEGLFREIYQNEINPINGFLDFFKELKAYQFLTGVATSAPRKNLDLIMNGLGLWTNMESIMSSEDVQKHKPDPEVYLQSAIKLDLSPNQCVVFEDSFSGVMAAKNAGMKVVGVLSSHQKEELPICDLYIDDYSQIKVDQVLEMLQIKLS